MLRWMIGTGLALGSLYFVAPPGLHAGGGSAERLELRARPDGLTGFAGTVTFTNPGTVSIDVVFEGDGTSLLEGDVFAAVGDEVDDSGTGVPLVIDGDSGSADGLPDFAPGRSYSILITGIEDDNGAGMIDFTATVPSERVLRGRTVLVSSD